VGAVLCGFMRAPDGYPWPVGAGRSCRPLEPGSMIKLEPGENVEFTEPPATDAAFDPFVRTQLRRIAAGLGIPYELLSGDLSAGHLRLWPCWPA
jgi:capsid protein